MMRSIFLALVLLVALAGSAQAHAFLDYADPAVGSTAAAPKTVSLTFTQSIEPNFSTIEVTDASGARVDQNDAHLAQGQGNVLMIGLKSLVPGTYTVTWHVTSVDTHKTQGSFPFTVTP